MKELIVILGLMVSPAAQPLGYEAIPDECTGTKPVCRDPQQALVCWCSTVTNSCDWYCVARKD